ncbi:tyrosine-type recombinase/integrase [Sphingobium sp. YBL2]|uniref:tyrosine-type recombinase/integrase n=1 Tax=Sphingobium sp. (strain YBL2) TaxID=484429 RepID=UPI0005CBB1DE|nr:tyrosine-type recombinase/integrase [Sphingobium sp. YBL2]AJR26687.1 integrase [Sphingobium sp. YBL2]AJR26815.1 integrase [Sphingobium sp. YBL2]|tara:strand:+ start:518 stop:2065 length:1548 start_codon:yes stop_codon:yes gene_type:complete
MPTRSFASFRPAPRRIEDPPSPDALFTAFLSSLSVDEGAACAVLYSAAVRHFLSWLGLRGIALETLDDHVAHRFEKHRCRCPGYSAQEPAYKADLAARVRRFIRFLEDQGYIVVADGIDDLGGHLAAYSHQIDALQLVEALSGAYRSEAEHFAIWLRVSRRPWTEVDEGVIEQYAGHDCRCPAFRKRGKLASSGMKRRRRFIRHFVAFLRDRGAIAPVGAKLEVHPDVAAYLGWLKQHRGATDATIRRYRPEVDRLIAMLGAPVLWDAAGLRSAFARRSKETPGSVSLLVTIMRSFLRFLIGQGQCRPALLHAIPSVQRYRLSTLPRYVDPATIERIISACPTDRPVQIRDKAIILLLARLGLRASDIRDMRLDDIDWRSGHLIVKGKSRRSERLPLPQDVGDAILAYLSTARPKAIDRHLFLRAHAPFRSLSSSAEIAGIVARTLERSGIEGLPTGSHIFRHSLATNMLRAGAGLESVGTILRHSSPETTAIYAKVDLPMLMKIAQPWPGDLSC